MSKKELRERTSFTAEIVEAADEAIEFLKGDDETAHRRILEWLVPQARDVLLRLRDGENIGKNSRAMVPVDATLMVLQHFDYLVQEAVDEMDLDGFDL